MAQKLRCYVCGKVIENENEIVMKNISTGYMGLSDERKAFHPTCWEMYHNKEKRQNKILLLVGLSIVMVFIAVIVYFALRYYNG